MTTIAVYGLPGMGRSSTIKALSQVNPKATFIEIDTDSAVTAHQTATLRGADVVVPAIGILRAMAG